MDLIGVLRTTPHQIRRWLANVMFGYGDAATSGLIYLVLTPLFVKALGAQGYAIWLITHTICFYLQFLDVGLGGAQIRYHARFHARDRSADVRKLSATIAVGMTIAGVVGLCLGVLLAFTPPQWWPETPVELQSQFRLTLCLLSINLLVAFPGSALNNIYEGIQRFDIRNLRSIALRIVTAIGQVILLRRGYGLVELAALELIMTSLRVILDTVVTSRLVPGLLNCSLSFHRDIWNRIRHFAIWSFADDLLVEGTPQLDSLFIVIVLPLALLTPYSLCMALGGALMMAVHPIIDTFFPIATAAHARSHRNGLRHMFVGGSKLCLTLATPIAVFLAFFGQRILNLWVPESTGQLSAMVLPVIVLDILFSAFLSVSAVILAAINGIRTVVILTLLEIGLTLLLILALAPSYGLLGVAIACLITNVGVGISVQLPIVARAVGEGLGSMLYNTLGRILVAAIPAILVAGTLAWLWPEANWLQLIFVALAIGAAFLLGLLVIGVTAAERYNYLEMFRRLNANSTAKADIAS